MQLTGHFEQGPVWDGDQVAICGLDAGDGAGEVMVLLLGYGSSYSITCSNSLPSDPPGPVAVRRRTASSARPSRRVRAKLAMGPGERGRSAVVLRPPVEPMLAQAAEAVPLPGVLREPAYEQKFDSHRALLFTALGPGGGGLLQTRRGSLVQDRLPDLVAAADQLPAGLVLDGELLVWDPEVGALSFEGLQRRAAARSRSATALAVRLPAQYVAFDILQADDQELLDLPYRDRRTLLQDLFADHALTAPWTLCPMTTDLGAGMAGVLD
ncbi:ATP-dependent DNA ligase [Streptomyces xanthophaeus]|uniref:ATP-dependent DNA ligase n=1 Tax=Streptomyces xanthophaeus TaxID=67385 RepID=UPI00365BEA9B